MAQEDEQLEYKKSLSQLKEGIISLSAMLNKHHKGTLYVGIKDDGKPFKFEITKKTLSDVLNDIRTNLKPSPVDLNVITEVVDGISVIKVYVEGDDTPYSAYGRYYIRMNDSDVLMTSEQLQKYFENKKDNYSKWEDKPTSCPMEDIDEDLLIEVIRKANELGRLTYVYKNTKDALTKFDLLDNKGYIKTAGYYLFGKNKPLTIKEGNYPTDSRTDFGEIKEFKGNIFECIDETIKYLSNNIKWKSEIVGIQRVETPEIPIRALREIVVNSFAHANYDNKTDFNSYIIYKSSIRIYNPGSIYHDLDPMKFAKAEVGSKIRNPLIASVLYKCGYIDAFGTGFDRTFTLCIKNNIDYEYKNDEFGFTFVFLRNTSYISGKINGKINGKISFYEKAVLSAIAIDKYITIPELATKIAKSQTMTYRYIKSLIDKGLLKRMESRKAGYWEITNEHKD